MGTEFVSPVGRIVTGNLWKAYPLTDDNNQPKLGADGTQLEEWFVALAFRKDDPAWPAFAEIITSQARAKWPQFFDPATGQAIR